MAALKEHAAGRRRRTSAGGFGIATETLYNWKRKYGGMEVSEAGRLRALEEEIRQLKRIVAEQAWTTGCSRISCQETSDARCPQAGRLPLP